MVFLFYFVADNHCIISIRKFPLAMEFNLLSYCGLVSFLLASELD